MRGRRRRGWSTCCARRASGHDAGAPGLPAVEWLLSSFVSAFVQRHHSVKYIFSTLMHQRLLPGVSCEAYGTGRHALYCRSQQPWQYRAPLLYCSPLLDKFAANAHHITLLYTPCHRLYLFKQHPCSHSRQC